jgi:hypothetical protein
MQRFARLALLFCCAYCCDAAKPIDIVGLTQAEVVAKVGFPHRVYVLGATIREGPGELFWYYCQRARSGKIEEKTVAFTGHPLRVSETDADIDPSRFLSLERHTDMWQIRKYQSAHPH